MEIKLADKRTCNLLVIILILVILFSGCIDNSESASWIIDSQSEWELNMSNSENLAFQDDCVEPKSVNGTYESIIRTFDNRKKPESITFKQSPKWDNWEKVDNIGPNDACNAPVLICVAEDDYWILDEPGEIEGVGGYHAWHSSDMAKWEHMGQVTNSSWVTTAEYADGKFYIYYDMPNDEDPHLVIDEDLTDGIYTDIGLVFEDPSHGSDAGILRDEDGTFHLIYEDWDPINARRNGWDSPLAGHADSPDGINGFKPHEYSPPIDERTKSTGEYDTYIHGTTLEAYRYEIHEPPQDAFGDYTVFKVGSQYYIFCDFDPAEGRIHLAYWTSDSIDKQFEWGGELGERMHPDPTMGFAEGKFYLLVQPEEYDYISSGPWVEKVEARVGADKDGDGEIDKWTDWRKVTEKYTRKQGFARIVKSIPAEINLSKLPTAYGFKFEFRLEDTTENISRPAIDKVELTFN